MHTNPPHQKSLCSNDIFQPYLERVEKWKTHVIAKDQENSEAQAFYNQIPKTPVLFLVGEHDLIHTEDVLSAMRKKMPVGSQVVSFENAGHFLHREVFPEYIVILKKFLNI